MKHIYVVGHRNPDTDSIVSAMAYAALRNALGDREYTPARLGELNDETKLVLERFGFDPPMRLYTVRTQVQDIAYDTPPVVSPAVTVNHAWNIVREDPSHLALPVADEEGALYGMLTSSDIAAYDIQSISDTTVDGIPLFNLLSALEGQLMNEPAQSGLSSSPAGSAGLAGPDAISGEVVIALPDFNPANITARHIVICGSQPAIIDAALARGAACIILCQADVPRQLRGASGTTIISTPLDAYRAARMIFQAIPVGRVCHRENLVKFHLSDYLDDVRETMLQSRFRSYPVLDENERVAGTVSRFHLIRPRRKRVVLVDHNELAQSVPGLEQAEILEIIDHHRLADVQTGAPIYFRNEPVGSTATIVARMFQERGIMPSPSMAGLIAAAIVSDTIMFKSPTCAERDRQIAARMARIAGISLEELGRDMFASVTSGERSAKDMLLSDFKEFHIAGHSLGIGQIVCMDYTSVMDRSGELYDAMRAEKEKHGYDFILMMLTDVLREGTELLFLGDAETIRQAFHVQTDGNAAFLPQVMSRKKQVVPMLSLMWG